ncbi:hypothetical protein DBV15_12143 [Temnothorax longispinosus]|uniref:Uncharacterized protein n=1 Tax=Temnothorax longispinosus TaxID=300112 RepID=A0A4S2KRE6_9HYME|nr:hypothetical protein DBV15_12143 [Temnothorax longispinosus]
MALSHQALNMSENMAAHQENSVRIKRAISFVIAQIAAQAANYWTIIKASEIHWRSIQHGKVFIVSIIRSSGYSVVQNCTPIH